MQRILLVLPSTTYRTHAFMSAAQKMDIDLVVASDHRQAMAELVPDTTLALNFRQPEAAAEKAKHFAQRKPFQAVVGVDDRSVYIATVIAEALGLPHNPVEAVQTARNKYLMRQKLAAAGMPVPHFEIFSVKKSPTRMAKKVNYPCVLKPVFLAASRGVSRADNPRQFKQAVEDIKSVLADTEAKAKAYGDEDKQVLVEDYIPGVEVALEGMLINREFKSLAIFDKPDPLEGPHFVETIYVTPSRLPGYVQREIIHAAQQAAFSLGLENGPVHAEMRINEKGVWVIEIAARSIGGLCSQVLKFERDMTLEELILRQALGEDVRAVQRERQAAGVMMVPIPKEGILKEIKGLEAAKAISGIEDIVITIPLNQKVIPMPQGGRYLGFIFAKGDLPEDVEESIREAYRKLRIEIEGLF